MTKPPIIPATRVKKAQTVRQILQYPKATDRLDTLDRVRTI